MGTVQEGRVGSSEAKLFLWNMTPILTLLNWAGTPFQCHNDNSSERLCQVGSSHLHRDPADIVAMFHRGWYSECHAN